MRTIAECKNAFSLVEKILSECTQQGYSLVNLKDISHLDSIELEHRLLSFFACVGHNFGDTFAYLTLQGSGSASSLPAHTECIYSPEVLRYFALGCINPSQEGGNTRIFDARKAASLLEVIDPSICNILLEYRSNAYPDATGRHRVVENGRVRFRSNGPTNKVINSLTYKDDELYSIVDKAIRDSLVSSVEWQKGDVLFVDNYNTLHDRESYRGNRKMLRVRYDDPHNCYVRYR
jgi:alpha-ketoglutarate-dependent taurine dioxygenase